jgi:hypothetical protein
VKNTFGIMVIIFLIIALIIGFVILQVLKKRGIDINSPQVPLKVFLYVFPIILIPIWFFNPKSTFEVKVSGSLIALVVAIINFFAVDRGGKILRHILGIKDKK